MVPFLLMWSDPIDSRLPAARTPARILIYMEMAFAAIVYGRKLPDLTGVPYLETPLLYTLLVGILPLAQATIYILLQKIGFFGAGE